MNTPSYPQISISLPYLPTSTPGWRQDLADSVPNYPTTLDQNYISSTTYQSVYYTDVRVPQPLDTDQYVYPTSYQDELRVPTKPGFQQPVSHAGQESLSYSELSEVQENYPVQPAITTTLQQIPISIGTPSNNLQPPNLPVSVPSSTYLCSTSLDGHPYSSSTLTSTPYSSTYSASNPYTTLTSRHIHASADSTTPDLNTPQPPFNPDLPAVTEDLKSTLMNRNQPISYQHPTFHPTSDSAVCSSAGTAPAPLPTQQPIDPNFPYHLFEYPAQTSGGGKAKKVKKRTEFSSKDLKVLEAAFAESDFARGAKRDQLATSLGVSLRSITVWFQNKRAKVRKERKRLEMLELAAKTGIVDGVDLKQ